MRFLKRISFVLLIVFFAIQFIPPARNIGNSVKKADMITTLKVPGNVRDILKKSCYDCHSNNTNYPWYANIQPFGWMLARHINKGKAELNFDEFFAYAHRRQLSKLRSIEGSVKDGSMPLASYQLLHQDAKLTTAEKALVIEWASKTKDSLSIRR